MVCGGGSGREGTERRKLEKTKADKEEEEKRDKKDWGRTTTAWCKCCLKRSRTKEGEKAR